MKNLLLVVLLVVSFANLFNISPIPHQVEGIVIAEPSWEIGYANKDGSFMVMFFAGCLPWKSCAINEPTDWYIGAH